MDPRERVMTIRLLEKTARHPGYAERLGIELAVQRVGESERQGASANVQGE